MCQLDHLDANIVNNSVLEVINRMPVYKSKLVTVLSVIFSILTFDSNDEVNVVKYDSDIVVCF